MAYQQDLSGSARRHLRAAKELDNIMSAGSQPGCKAVAGYLFGLASELALKQIMHDSGTAPLPQESRRDDPFYAHFPELKTQLIRAAVGRRASEIRRFADTPSLLQEWDTNMRYSPTSDIKQRWIDAWKKDAEKLLAAMDAF